MLEINVQETARAHGVSRRDFLKFCSLMAGVLALPGRYAKQIGQALAATGKPPVIWVEFQDCAGNSEALLRASRPTVSELILDVLSVDYHETIMAAAGHQAEEAKMPQLKKADTSLLWKARSRRKMMGSIARLAGKPPWISFNMPRPMPLP